MAGPGVPFFLCSQEAHTLIIIHEQDEKNPLCSSLPTSSAPCPDVTSNLNIIKSRAVLQAPNLFDFHPPPMATTAERNRVLFHVKQLRVLLSCWKAGNAAYQNALRLVSSLLELMQKPSGSCWLTYRLLHW